jgi:hypothetical protein
MHNHMSHTEPHTAKQIATPTHRDTQSHNGTRFFCWHFFEGPQLGLWVRLVLLVKVRALELDLVHVPLPQPRDPAVAGSDHPFGPELSHPKHYLLAQPALSIRGSDPKPCFCPIVCGPCKGQPGCPRAGCSKCASCTWGTAPL